MFTNDCYSNPEMVVCQHPMAKIAERHRNRLGLASWPSPASSAMEIGKAQSRRDAPCAILAHIPALVAVATLRKSAPELVLISCWDEELLVWGEKN